MVVKVVSDKTETDREHPKEHRQVIVRVPVRELPEETVNGSLGHGPGVGSGMALALKRQGSDRRVVVVTGDGELHEGAVWEAFMFAVQHRLDNLILIVDDNSRCMMGDTANVVGLAPLADKFSAFGWSVDEVSGHDVDALCEVISRAMSSAFPGPRVVIAHTIKGKGVSFMEGNNAFHGVAPTREEVKRALEELR